MTDNNTLELPDPLVPADVDLRDFPFLPIDITRLFDSEFHARAEDGEWRAGITLWLKSFHQVPAASIPDDDVLLARLAEYGRDVASWKEIKQMALHGWVKCSDGRLYHPVVAEKAMEAWNKRKSQSNRGKLGNAKRWAKSQPSPEEDKDIANESQKDRLAITEGSLSDGESEKNFSPEDRKGQGEGYGHMGVLRTCAHEEVPEIKAPGPEAPPPMDEAPKPSETDTAFRRCGEVAAMLRKSGVNITSMNPELTDWVTLGVTDEEAIEAVERARAPNCKPAPEVIPASYLNAIVRKVIAERDRRNAKTPAAGKHTPGFSTSSTSKNAKRGHYATNPRHAASQPDSGADQVGHHTTDNAPIVEYL
jgi:hypothetical protein